VQKYLPIWNTGSSQLLRYLLESVIRNDDKCQVGW
jgi:hypothetical protein